MNRLLLVAIVSAVFGVGCATPSPESVRQEFALPVYYSEAGVDGEYTEAGPPLTGEYEGKCGNNGHLVNEAMRDLISQAESYEADAVVLPNSVTARGRHNEPVESCAYGIDATMCTLTCGVSPLVRLIMGKSGRHEVTGLPIRYESAGDD